MRYIWLNFENRINLEHFQLWFQAGIAVMNIS